MNRSVKKLFSMRFVLWLSLLVLFQWPLIASAHEARPGYLELRETSTGQYQVLWKQPANGDMALRLTPQFPAECTVLGQDNKQLIPGALLSRFTLTCKTNLAGKTITIGGLDETLTDVLVRLYSRDSGDETHLARSTEPSITLNGSNSGGWWNGLARAGTYLLLGIQHILMGIDHLLFVLGLLLIVRDTRTLIKTVTAFTVAHSITLAAATLGYASVPMLPLNAAIALSILFLGPEIMRAEHGKTSLTIRCPWIVAFAFGLLHGFGFATGLTSMGLPKNEIPEALLLFNVGVEFGQLGFILLMLNLGRAFRLMEISWARPVALIPAYSVGILGAFWTIQRMVLFVGGLV